MRRLEARERAVTSTGILLLVAYLAMIGALSYHCYQFSLADAPGPRPLRTRLESEKVIARRAMEARFGSKKPSELISAVMAANFPSLWEEEPETSRTLQSPYAEVIEYMKWQRSLSGPMEPFWVIAETICEEIVAVERAHNEAATGISFQSTQQPLVLSSVPNVADKVSLQKKWQKSIPARKRKIDRIYQQLLAAESQRKD